MTKWLNIARKYEGTAEVKGPASNPMILHWLQVEGGGASWVKDDATPWCGAFMAAVFTEAGMANVIPKAPLAAISWASVGERLTEPKVGCICVVPRTGGNHVFLVEDFDDKTLLGLGGNQSDTVGAATFHRDDRHAIYVWPVKTKTPADLAATSRIAAAAQRQKRDATVSGLNTTATQLPNPIKAAPPAPPKVSGIREGVDSVLGDLTWVKSSTGKLFEFASFAAVRWQWLALGLALYFAARFLWDSHLIAKWRTEDHNEGYTT